MLKLRSLLCALLAALVLLSACSGGAGDDSIPNIQGSPGATTVPDNVKSEDLDAHWDEKATIITLDGESASVSGGGASVSGSVVTIGSAGTYVVSGTLTDGQIIVKAPESALVRLVLNGVSISNSVTSPVYCEQADKLLIIMADGSENTVTDSESYVFPSADDDEPNAAIFSKVDMTINGGGTLTVNANYNNGIGTKDDLVIVSGTLVVTAPNDALRGRDSVTVLGGGLTLAAGGDAIQSNNDTAEDKGWIELYGGSYDITAANDGIQAETHLSIADGDFIIVTGGGSSNAPKRAEDMRGDGADRRGGAINLPPQAGEWGQMPQERPDGGQMPSQARERGQMPQEISGGSDQQTPQARERGQMPQEWPGVGQVPQGRPGGGQQPPTESARDRNAAPGEFMPPDTDTAANSTKEDESGANAVSDSCKGIKAGTDITISGGNFVIDSADDALHANGNISVSGGELTISTGDDGMHADANLVISDSAKIDILTSYEGIEGISVTISGGNVSVVATDDGINAAGGAGGGEGGAFGQDRFSGSLGNRWIRIDGGNVDITAGTDGLDSNGDLYISGGVITFNMTNPNVAGGDGMLDRDGALSITGGVILGAGANGVVTMGRGMGASGNSSTQPILQLYYTETQNAETLVELKTSSGAVAAEFTPERDFKCIIISTPELKDGESYSLYTGGIKTLDITLSGDVTSLLDTGEEAVQTFGGRNPGM